MPHVAYYLPLEVLYGSEDAAGDHVARGQSWKPYFDLVEPGICRNLTPLHFAGLDRDRRLVNERHVSAEVAQLGRVDARA